MPGYCPETAATTHSSSRDTSRCSIVAAGLLGGLSSPPLQGPGQLPLLPQGLRPPRLHYLESMLSILLPIYTFALLSEWGTTPVLHVCTVLVSGNGGIPPSNSVLPVSGLQSWSTGIFVQVFWKIFFLLAEVYHSVLFRSQGGWSFTRNL